MSRAREPELARIGALVRRIGVGMLGTRALDGRWVTRPVEVRLRPDMPFAGEVWILTRASSHKVAEIRAHPQVNIALASARRNAYLSLSGTAGVRRDRRRIAQLWTPMQRVYYPLGPDDPDLTVVRVRIASAERWEGPAGLLGQAVRVAFAAITRDPAAMGDNRTVRIARVGASACVVSGNTRGAGAASRPRRKP